MSEYNYRIELHAHTSPVSPCGRVETKRVVEAYAELGFDGIVIANHFNANVLKGDTETEKIRYYLKDYLAAKTEGERLGVKVYLGCEIRFPESYNEYLIYGINESDIKEMFKYIQKDYQIFYKGFKNEKNVILQAHPFRKNMILEDPKLLDGMEVFNCHPNQNSAIAQAARYADKFPHFIKTAGTDFHHEGHQGLGYIKTKILPEDSFELAEILKSGEFINCIAGYELIR